jgi:UDP-glucuronate 4-epimerase
MHSRLRVLMVYSDDRRRTSYRRLAGSSCDWRLTCLLIYSPNEISNRISLFLNLPSGGTKPIHSISQPNIPIMKLPLAISLPSLLQVSDASCDSDDDLSNDSTNDSTSTSPCSDDDEEQQQTLVPPHTGYKKVLVTGGAGFIGSSVAEYLLRRGDDVVVVDEMNDYYDISLKQSNLDILRAAYPDANRLSIYKGDICDEALMRQIFETEKPEWVCHMAARAGVRPSINDPYVYIHSNIKGTTQLMDLSVQFGVKNFVFASSSSVYGGSMSTLFKETELVDHPVSPYAATKKACELLAYTYHHLYNLPVSALRFFTVYGPRGRPDMAPFMFIDRVSRGLEIQQFGDGSSSRDYTYIEDICDGVVRAIDRPHGYEVFNLGKGSGTSLTEFIDLVQKYTGQSAKVKILPDQPGDVPYTCADVSKAERMLGYRSKVSFEEGICRTVSWYKDTYGAKNGDTMEHGLSTVIDATRSLVLTA